jgi:hypothetical protein
LGQYPAKFGKYILLERVNVGGMAEVFKAKAFGVAGFERIIALKRILPSLVEDEEFIRMFIDEARIAVQLDHPNIVQIYELGKHGEHYYIAMEYLASRDLRAILDKLRASGQLMSIPQAAWATARACEGLDYAHRRADASGEPMNIIHRDVSPQNVLVTFDGDVKVIDFGIAKAANRASKTQAGVLKGKFGYMSPEQVRGLPIDRRSDIFAVGVLLYEMLTGERLFIGESDFSTLERVRNAEVIPPTTFNKKISPELERVVLKSLAREPEDRYQWGSELAADLQKFVGQDGQPFGRSNLAQFMGKLYAREIAKENASTEAFLKLQLGDVVGRQRPAAYDDDDDATNVNAPMMPPTDDDSGRVEPMDQPGDGIEYEEFDGEDKTFVLEASEAGLALQPGQEPSSELAPPPQDFLGEPSLYGDDDEELFDDSATMVSADNPFDEGNTDDGQVSPDDATRVPGMESIEDHTHVPVAGGNTASQTTLPPPTMTLQDGPPDAISDPVAAAMAQDNSVAPPMSASGPAASSGMLPPPNQASPSLPPPSQTSGLMPTPAPTPVEPPAPLFEETADVGVRARPPQPAGLSKGVMGALIAGLAVSFLVLIGTAIFAVVKLTSPGGPSNVMLSANGTPPAGVAIYLDDQPVGEQLPIAFPVTPSVAHKLKVTAPGFQTVEMPLELPPGAQLPIQIPLVPDRTASAANPAADPAAPAADPAEKPAADPAVDPAADPAEKPVADLPPVALDTWRVSLTAVSGGRSVHGAGIYLDGELLGVTPFEHEFPKSQPQLALEFRAQGFATKQVQVGCGGCDGVGPMSVNLVAPPAGAAAATTPPAVAVAAATPDPAVAAPAAETPPVETPPAETPPAATPPPPVEKPADPAPAVAAKAPKKTPPRVAAATRKEPPKRPAATKKRAKRKRIPVLIGTRPYAKVYLNGRKHPHSTPLMGDRALKLTSGRHTIEFVDDKGKRYKYKVTVLKESEEARLVIILGKSIRKAEGVRAHLVK